MFLHDDRDNFRNLIEQVVNETGKAGAVIEKDYYVTLILRFLAERMDNVVFKGGTSLSKGFHAINRFSEDIDITFSVHIGEARRKKLKNTVIKSISETLNMPIFNWDSTQSDRDYNEYRFSYESVFNIDDDRIPDSVKMETALGSYSFPTERVLIGNYIGDYLLKAGRDDLARGFMLDTFYMQLQSINRTYIDKVFALCDYYIERKSKRYSRHLYDIKKLTPMLSFDDEMKKLFEEVRLHRSGMVVCPSAQEAVNIPELIREFCDTDFYQKDYQDITEYFTDDLIEYEECKKQMLAIASWIESIK
ncbi:MAG: nucleotidyl transferase AbiEii/AbiGii toxin family protein [Lachnospiraceae bacterium]|nr:nucleotidyl transferase AbiEii/AbiGii toxin family protein [Lachnospiraceae bacterium]